ncbi:NUDIX hydrolase [Kitasatospora cheerisanensis]|uniref:Nudix hydrolase domain-containing protein n=1 Tax=Kitasatospora cheerisanensis KCTC 2395 TaxID=1348663 RepID=A0A066Z2U3_9ACTN|nr:NUDIX domain-containing protein [Kitasatospora cheerisanensis]KDN84646.1 hypothetical protein KCH_37380 [Kitasatospora cheerisanensis KCTC 2395]
MTEPGVAVAVVVRDGRVLMVQRRAADGELWWQFPAGEVRDGETAEAAAARETAGQTGLSVTAARLLAERAHPVNGLRTAYFACSVAAGPASVAGVEDLVALEWVTRGRLAEYVPSGLCGPVQAYLDGELSRD